MLFTDLVGSTELRSRLGEDGAEALRRKHDALVAGAIEANRGRVVKNLGDGVMSTFAGASDAVGAAVAIQQAIERHNRSTEAPLEVRIGISAGDVTDEEGDCFGTPVIETARLCAVARGGQILATEVVRLLAGSAGGHPLTPVGVLELKGLPAPVPACEVVWEPLPTAAAPLPALLAGTGPTFVGREAELKRLRDAWAEARSGRRRLVMVEGEPGIGKTRLCSQLAQEVFDDGGLVLYGRCDEESVVPYQPFVEVLRQLMAAGLAPDILPPRQRADLTRLLPELADPASGARETRGEDPETERYRLFEAVVDWLTGVSRRAPTLVILDDLHWATRPTCLLVRHIVGGVDSSGVLLLATYRDVELGRGDPLSDVLTALRREGFSERVHLRGLETSEVRALLESRAGHEFEADEMRLYEAIWAEAEGNPFFILEITRHLAETGRLHLSDGRWVLEATSLVELDLPETVRDVIGRRLSRLSEMSNVALAHAAILGREFDFGVLAAMSGMDDEVLLNAVEEGLGARLVTEVAGRTEPAYAFTQALVRDALLQDLTLARKQRLHLRAAEAIDALDGKVRASAAALTVHYRQAGNLAPPEKAIDAAIEAGREAARALAWEEVAFYWQTASELMESDGADPARRADLLARLAALLYVTGLDPARAIEHTDTALGLYEEVGQAERAAVMRGRLAGYLTTFPESMDVPAALRHSEAAKRVLEAGPESPALGYIYEGIAAAGLWGARTDEGLAASQRAMDIGDRHQDTPLWLLGATFHGYHLWAHGSLRKGRELLEQAWKMADEIDHRITAMVAVWIRGGDAIRLFDPLDGVAWYERELAKPRLARAPIQRRILQAQLAWALILSGELDKGRRIAAEASELLVGDNFAPPLELWEGRWPAAEVRLRLARDQARARGDRYNEAGVGQWLAETYRLLGDDEQAEAVLREALLIALDGPEVPREVSLRLLLALICGARGRIGDARGDLGRVRELVTGDEDWRGLVGRLALAQAVLAVAEGHHKDAAAHFEQAVEKFRQYTVPWEEAEAFLLWGRALIEAGEPARAEARFDLAADIYRRIGASEPWLERIKDERNRV